MAISYVFNPYQDQIDNNIKRETIKVASEARRKEFVPRYAPFFSNEFKLYRRDDPNPLKLGVDYVFAHPFDKFIKDWNRNVFGSVVLLKEFAGEVLEADYSTIGGPFTFDTQEYIEFIANILNQPRRLSWEDLDPNSIPDAWPPAPHDHPVSNTYDYQEMLDAVTSLIGVIMDADANAPITTRDMLEQHMREDIDRAHGFDLELVGLDKLPNAPFATVADLNGNSENLIMSLGVFKEAMRMFKAGTLNL